MRIKYLLLVVALTCLKLVDAQITPAFSANVTSGCPSLLVIVTDNSSSTAGAIVAPWEWEMTGPVGFTTLTGASNQISPNLTIPGLYTVKLKVTDSAGNMDSLTMVDYIEVFAPPTISYSISPLQGCAPQTVCFDGTITPGCGVLTNSVFDSNDGTLYSTEDFCHTYNSAGDYFDFLVSATNSCGCSTTEIITDTISIVDMPVASFNAPQTIFCASPSVVNFNNMSTASAAVTYSWTITETGTGNPTGVTNDPSFNISPNLTEGTYDVELIVTEPGGCADTLLLANYITIVNPSADFTSDTTSICPGESIQFTDLSVGSPIGWSWQFFGGGAPPMNTNQNPNIVFTDEGNYGVQLTTTYAGGCQDVELKVAYITVHDLPVSDLMAGDSLSCLVPFTTSFTSLSTNSVSTEWSFPGGTPSTFTGVGPFNVTYNAFGDYNVIMFDTTANGCVTQTNFPNFISVTQLTVNVTADTIDGCIPVVSNLSVTTNGIDPIDTYSWTLAGSVPNTSSLSDPVVTYNAVGCYDVVLDIVSDEGCLVNVTENNLICAGTPPMANFSFVPIQACFEEEPVIFTFTGTGADSVLWNFGEGPLQWAGPGTSPSHDYLTDIGDYTPSIIAYQYGCPSDTLIYPDSVSIDGPIASFDAEFESCDNWNTFNFVNTSVEYDSVFWVFGDPSVPMGTDTFSGDSVSWTYPAIEAITTYSVTVTAYNDSTGCDHSNTMTIDVYPPNADFTMSDTVGCYPLTVTYTNTSLSTGAAPFNTKWNWNGTYAFSGAGFGVIWDRGTPFNKNYPIPGIYDVIMQNTDVRGCRDTIENFNALTIHGSLPGFFSDLDEGCFPLTVNFTDTSVAPLTYIADWHWDFGTGNASDTSNLEDPQFIYTQGGTYTVTLSVTDSFGCVNTIAYNNYIYVHDPIASFSLADTFLCTNQNLGITNLSTGDALTYNWQFPGGAPPYLIDGNPPAYSYATEGVFNIELQVTDDLMCTDDTIMSISVFDVVAIGSASADYSSCSNPPLLVNFTNSSINNVDTTTAFWDFGNGTTSTDLNPSVLYGSPGNFVVTFSISSLTGCSDTSIVDTIVVEGPWGNLELLSDPLTCNCDSAIFSIKTINANTPIILSGTGQAIPFFPTPALSGDTVYDTLMIEYCGVGVFGPSLSFSEGGCTYSVDANPTDSVRVDSLVTNFGFVEEVHCDTGTICFTDSSYSEIGGTTNLVSWFWSFGDGSISPMQNPCHLYTGPGTYNVCLTVENTNGCIKTFCDSVLIRANPIASFETSDTSVCINNNIIFYDSTVTDAGSSIVDWHWDFGTANPSDTSIIQNPNFTYTSTGVIDVIMHVEDNFGCVDSDTSQVEIFNNPVIIASNDTSVCENDSVQLTASGGVVYDWYPNYNISDSTLQSPFMSPITDTLYFVLGTDINGCSALDSVLVGVNNIQASFDFTTACAGDTVFFSDSSTTSSGALTMWTWDFDDPASGVNNSSNLQNPFHIFSASGNFNVNLSVNNTIGCSSDTTKVVAVSVPPTAIIDFDSACVNTAINFNSVSSLSGSGVIIGTDWDFGTANPADTSDLAAPTFTYTSPGLYNVCLTITSDLACAGNTHDTCVTVMVYAGPSASETLDSTCLGGDISFDDTSIPGDGNIIANFWNFGTVIPADTALILSNNGDITFTYGAFGNYPVTHIVTDDLGCIDTSTVNAYVFDNPVANYTTMSACINDDSQFTSTSTAGLDGENALSDYSWDFDEGASFNTGTAIETFVFLNAGPHNVSLAISDDFGCVDTIVQVISPTALPVAAITISDSVVCNGETVNLDASASTFVTPGIQYFWDEDFNTGTDNMTVTYSYMPTTNAQIMLAVQDDNNCTDTAYVSMTVNQGPNASFTFGEGCVNLPIDLNSTSTQGDVAINSYDWLINGVGGPSGQNTTFVTPTASSVTGQLIVTDLNNCTDTSAVFNITVDTTTNAIIGGNDTVLCESADLMYSVSGSSNSYLWSPQNIIDNATADLITASVTNSVSIIVVGTSANDLCPESSDTVNVLIATEPDVTYTVDQNPLFIGLSTDVELDVTPFNSNDSVIWENNATLSEFFGLEVEASPTETTDYPFSVYYYFNSVRCQLDSFVNIQVIDECSSELIYAPNVFTPNNDGQNDHFKISGISVDVLTSLRIFDRWGQLVFESENIEFKNGRFKNIEDAWDGNNKNGNYCNNGVYVFMYEGSCLNGETVIGSGNVTILR